MIRYFSRQALHIRAGNGGQATILFLVVAGTLLTLVLASITLNNVAVARVSCANAVDAVALNAATWEARCLNMIAALNDGIAQCLRVIRYTCVVWSAMAVAAAFGVGVPAFLEYSRYARELIRNCWKTAHQLAAWSEKIREAAPYLVLGETAALAKKRKVTGVLFPMNPRGAHDGRNTLELHLEHGPPVHLLDAIAPVTSVLNRLRKIRYASSAVKGVISLLDFGLGFIFQDSEGPIRMLVPEKDFPERQYVRFAGSMKPPVLPIPFLGGNRENTVLAEALAEPYGGGSAEMTWRSRLAERKAK